MRISSDRYQRIPGHLGKYYSIITIFHCELSDASSFSKMHDDGYDSPSCSRRASLASNTDFRRKSSLAINENAEIEGKGVTISYES